MKTAAAGASNSSSSAAAAATAAAITVDGVDNKTSTTKAAVLDVTAADAGAAPAQVVMAADNKRSILFTIPPTGGAAAAGAGAGAGAAPTPPQLGPQRGRPCLQSTRLFSGVYPAPMDTPGGGVTGGDSGAPALSKALLLKMNAYLRELEIPEAPLPTRAVCDLVDQIKLSTIALLTLQKTLARKPKEVADLSVSIASVPAAAAAAAASSSSSSSSSASVTIAPATEPSLAGHVHVPAVPSDASVAAVVDGSTVATAVVHNNGAPLFVPKLEPSAGMLA
jgi:hypothetical protein